MKKQEEKQTPIQKNRPNSPSQKKKPNNPKAAKIFPSDDIVRKIDEVIIDEISVLDDAEKLAAEKLEKATKQYDYFGEINPEVNNNQECAKSLDKLMTMFDLKIIGEQYRTVYLLGIGKLDLTFVDYCKDLKDLKTWLRTGINKV